MVTGLGSLYLRFQGENQHFPHSPSLLASDSAGHRAVQLHAKGRNGCVPARWGLDRQLSSPEKGISVEAGLAALKLALWLARRPSEIVCWGHPEGQGFIAHGGMREAISFSPLCRLLLCAGLLLPQPVQYQLIMPTFFPRSSGLSLPGTGAKLEYGIFPAGLWDCCCQGDCGRVGE